MYTQTHLTCTYTYTKRVRVCARAHIHTPTHTHTHPPHAHMTNYLFETPSIIHLARRVPSLQFHFPLLLVTLTLLKQSPS